MQDDLRDCSQTSCTWVHVGTAKPPEVFLYSSEILMKIQLPGFLAIRGNSGNGESLLRSDPYGKIVLLLNKFSPSAGLSVHKQFT